MFICASLDKEAASVARRLGVNPSCLSSVLMALWTGMQAEAG